MTAVPAQVRVTVTSATRRVDLVLPATVPVAELVPELARSVGMLDAVTVHGGYRLVTRSGRALVADESLAAQGVVDGGLVAVAAGPRDQQPRRHDEMAEAMADAVALDQPTWDPEAGRTAALLVALLLLLVGAGGLALQGGSGVAAAAMVVAVVLVAGAILLSRRRGEGAAAVAVAWTGCAYAAVAGLALGPGDSFLGTPVAAVGAGAMAAGLVAALGLAERRALLFPPVVAGAVLLGGGLVAHGSSTPPAVVLTVALTVAVVAGSAVPWLALTAVGTLADVTLRPDDPVEIDLDRVRADARTAHEIVVALSLSVGLLLVMVAPLAVSSGLAGTLVAVLASVVVTLRTRPWGSAIEVLVGLSAGALGLVATALSVLWLHPPWREDTCLALVAAGVALLGVARLPHGLPVRCGRLADVTEVLALLALPPVLVVATGVLPVIAR